MPYSTRYPAENASFNSVVFWEASKVARAAEAERVIVGQTVIGRYTRPGELTIRGFCGSTEVGSLRSAVNSSHTLVYSGGSVSAYLTSVQSEYDDAFAVYAITLAFIL